MKRVCANPDCDSTRHYAKGLCRNCYSRKLYGGSYEYEILTEDDIDKIVNDLFTLQFPSITSLAREHKRRGPTLFKVLEGRTDTGKEYRRKNPTKAWVLDVLLDYYKETSGRLSPLTIMSIKEDRKKGMSIYELEAKYNRNYSGIWRIVEGIRYSNFDYYLPMFRTLITMGYAEVNNVQNNS